MFVGEKARRSHKCNTMRSLDEKALGHLPTPLLRGNFVKSATCQKSDALAQPPVSQEHMKNTQNASKKNTNALPIPN